MFTDVGYIWDKERTHHPSSNTMAAERRSAKYSRVETTPFTNGMQKHSGKEREMTQG